MLKIICITYLFSNFVTGTSLQGTTDATDAFLDAIGASHGRELYTCKNAHCCAKAGSNFCGKDSSSKWASVAACCTCGTPPNYCCGSDYDIYKNCATKAAAPPPAPYPPPPDMSGVAAAAAAGATGVSVATVGADFAANKILERVMEKAIEKIQEKIQQKVMDKLESQAIQGNIKKARFRTLFAQWVLTLLTIVSVATAVYSITLSPDIFPIIAAAVSGLSFLLRIWRFKGSCTKTSKLSDLVTKMDDFAKGGDMDKLQGAVDALKSKRASKKTPSTQASV